MVEGGFKGSRRWSIQESRDFIYSQNFKVISHLYYYVISNFAIKNRKDIIEKKDFSENFIQIDTVILELHRMFYF